MNNLNSGEVVQIHSYKHDGNIHRAWQQTVVIENSNDLIIGANNKTKVTESDGRNWYTREPAVCYFYKNHWFNVIGMLRKDGVHYYCNLSSPYLFEEGTIKYIDYDLDVKVFPDFNFKILDRDEYDKHRKRMQYPPKIQAVIDQELQFLLNMINNREGPFRPGITEHWYRVYINNIIGGI
ncbi:DUF402 domain-containing protein [Haloplasma contractile]|uniref:DUF402 domain-containing protein n=1 Tax=Haloplasma contractile SSD-17B TaxID=1033810 RepID=U2EE93_9MOLU|nr:DUF402 domain-containing protein [Haloplasma contractile]ERJ13006.1 hypothetical protein HLPCO_000605 [Haloplasma contractile SSD-17B]